MTAVYVPIYPRAKYVSRAFLAARLQPTFTALHFFRSQLGQSDRPGNVVISNAPDIETAEKIVHAQTGRPSLFSEPVTAHEIARRFHQDKLGAFLVFRGFGADGKIAATDILKTPVTTRDSALYFADRKNSLVDFFNKIFLEPQNPATISQDALRRSFVRRPQDGTHIYVAQILPCCSL